jgi:hypothetical protein
MSRRTKPRTAARAEPDLKGFPLPALFATAVIEGVSVILVEIVGARALAPYFGSSLTVWTAQISATLLFLALGYRLGGRLSLSPNPSHLPILFGLAGAWLALYPILRAPVSGTSASLFSVGGGSFITAVVLFGTPLLCLGAVSPVLVSYIDRSRPGAGSAAGTLFFTNTLGGLAGGWMTAFLVIPFLSIRVCLTGTGALLVLIGAAWAAASRRMKIAWLCLAVSAVGCGAALAPRPMSARSLSGDPVTLRYSRQSQIGLVQVVDRPAANTRELLIDGIFQGQMSGKSGLPSMVFIEYLNRLSHLYHPEAKEALLLGLGAGLRPSS